MKAFKSYFTPEQEAAAAAANGGPRRSGSKRGSSERPDPLELLPPPTAAGNGSRWSGSSAGGNGSASPKRPNMNSRQSTMSLAPYLNQQGNRQSGLSLHDVKADVMVSHIYQDQLRRMYAQDWNLAEGVVLKKSRNNYVCAPPQLRDFPNGFFDMVSQLNVGVSENDRS